MPPTPSLQERFKAAQVRVKAAAEALERHKIAEIAAV